MRRLVVSAALTDHPVLILGEAGTGKEVVALWIHKQGIARIIAATNRNLALMVDAGTFREDLFYRWRSFPIRTPPLFSEKTSLSAEILELLKGYPWKGNARELRSFLDYVSTLANGCTPTPKLVREAFGDWTGRPGEWNAP